MTQTIERLNSGRWVPHWLQHQHIARYEWAAQFAKDMRVIDAACADGYGSAMLADAGAREVRGFDLDEASITAAVETHAAENVSFQVADVTALPVEKASCDLLVSFETIEHLPDDRMFLSEVQRVLAPGGTFVCSTPNRELTNPGIDLSGKPFNPFHLREYSIEELRGLLEEFFSDVTGYGQSFYGRGYAKLLRRIGRWGNMAAVRSHQMRKLVGIPWERIDKHRPQPLMADRVPEVQLFVCKREG